MKLLKVLKRMARCSGGHVVDDAFGYLIQVFAQGAGTGGAVDFLRVVFCETGIARVGILVLFATGLQFLGHRMGV